MLDVSAIDNLCRAMLAQMADQSQEFLLFEGSDDEFQSVVARFLETYGGSLGLSLLLRHHRRVSRLRRQNLVDIVSLMNTNRRMGADVLLEFYARFTRVPLEQFSFLDDLGIEHETAYGSSFFETASSTDNYGEWEVLTPDESNARIHVQNNLPIEVTKELKKIVSLESQLDNVQASRIDL